MSNRHDRYAVIYECSVDTIKRWVRIGKEKSDPPPLDDPKAMRDWIARSFGGIKLK